MTSRSWPLRILLLVVVLGASRSAAAQTFPACGANALCLAGGRFQIAVDWQTPTDSGAAHPVLLTPSTGYFWFFDAANVELLVKVLDACEDYGHEWVFAGGLTDVGVAMTVTDEQTGVSKIYTSPRGTAFFPIQDTSTFTSGCPPPPPPEPLKGIWTGTFNSVDAGPGDYDCIPNVPAHASFTQHGTEVDGTIWAATANPGGCGGNGVAFHGTFDGYTLEGTITGGGPHYGFSAGSTARGTLSNTSLQLILTNNAPPNSSLRPGGTLVLRREP